ncbi:hypothetical protein ACTQ0G_03420 [Oscillospiraceae bacterium LCP21S3_A1]
MKTKILTAIAMLLTIATIAGCASSKPIPYAAQHQAPASAAEQSHPQELRESVDESKATDSHTEAKPEGTAEKEMITSTLPTGPVQTEPAPESAPTAMPETSVESAPTRPTEVPSQPTEPAKPTVPEPEPAAPPQPTEHPKPTEPAPTAPIPTEPQPTEPAGCTHDWVCIQHSEEGHWKAGIVCDCGWTVYGNPDEVAAAWNAHSASFPPEEALFEHGGFGCVDEWVVDAPAYEEWYCTLCGETKP